MCFRYSHLILWFFPTTWKMCPYMWMDVKSMIRWLSQLLYLPWSDYLSSGTTNTPKLVFTSANFCKKSSAFTNRRVATVQPHLHEERIYCQKKSNLTMTFDVQKCIKINFRFIKKTFKTSLVQKWHAELCSRN